MVPILAQCNTGNTHTHRSHAFQWTMYTTYTRANHSQLQYNTHYNTHTTSLKHTSQLTVYVHNELCQAPYMTYTHGTTNTFQRIHTTILTQCTHTNTPHIMHTVGLSHLRPDHPSSASYTVSSIPHPVHISRATGHAHKAQTHTMLQA